MNEATKPEVNALTATQEQSLREKEQNALTKAIGLLIENEEELIFAGQLITGIIKPLIKEVKARFDQSVKDKKRVYDNERTRKKTHIAPLEEAKEIVEGKQAAYLKKQKELREAQELGLQRLAQEEAERLLEDKGVVATEAGDYEEAKDLRQQAEAVVVEKPDIQTKVELPPGQHIQINWSYEVLDLAKIPRMFLKIDESALTKFASTHKENAVVEGVRFYTTETIVSK